MSIPEPGAIAVQPDYPSRSGASQLIRRRPLDGLAAGDAERPEGETAMATPTQLVGTAVAGYFASGHEAHRAIHALIDAGFEPTAIGAAFHTGLENAAPAPERRPNVGGELREEIGTTLPGFPPNRARATGGGAASDTSSVQYASLGGGAGTPIDGASRPGPIPGTDVLHSGLPSELPHELPHEGDLRAGTGAAPQREEVGVTRGGVDAPGSLEPIPRHAARTVEPSWGERLKHIFGHGSVHRGGGVPAQQRTAGKDDLTAEMRREAQDFGTGEGHLNLNPQRRYSQSAFEQSFTGYGIEPERARGFGRGLRKGGAVVTVHAGPRAMEAESILEAHGGTARLATDTEVDGNLADEGHVEVLGTVGRDYPSYLD